MTVLAVAHNLGGEGRIAAQQAAELADDALGTAGRVVEASGRAFIQVDVLTGERRASAVGAAMTIGLERPYATTEEEALELLDVACGDHRLRDSLPRGRFLPGGHDRDRPWSYAVSANRRSLFTTTEPRVTPLWQQMMRPFWVARCATSTSQRLGAENTPQPGNRKDFLPFIRTRENGWY